MKNLFVTAIVTTLLGFSVPVLAEPPPPCGEACESGVCDLWSSTCLCEGGDPTARPAECSLDEDCTENEVCVTDRVVFQSEPMGAGVCAPVDAAGELDLTSISCGVSPQPEPRVRGCSVLDANQSAGPLLLTSLLVLGLALRRRDRERAA